MSSSATTSSSVVSSSATTSSVVVSCSATTSSVSAVASSSATTSPSSSLPAITDLGIGSAGFAFELTMSLTDASSGIFNMLELSSGFEFVGVGPPRSSYGAPPETIGSAGLAFLVTTLSIFCKLLPRAN